MGTAIVTGAARGIGREVAQTLAAEGYDLVLVDLADAGAGFANPAGVSVLAVDADVSSEEDVAALTAQVDGAPDVLVNCAGISHIAPAEATTAAQWRRVLDVNLTGPFLLCRAFAPALLAAGRGSVVNVASIAGLHAVADRAAYNASKHGLIGLTRTLAAEWGGRGVRVNAVCPGWVKTPMDDEDQAAGGYSDADIVDRVPMARFAAAGDIAQAILFLADPAKSGFVNGVALPVDGGWTADASWDALRVRKR